MTLKPEIAAALGPEKAALVEANFAALRQAIGPANRLNYPARMASGALENLLCIEEPDSTEEP
jgi:hypothetical protein